MRRFLRISTIGAAVLLAAGGVPASQAGEICVQCEAPAATYLCQAEAASEHQAFLQNRRLIQLACIRNIAKTYGHSTCKANAAEQQACNAPAVRVDLTEMARQYVNRLPAPLRQNDKATANGQFSAPPPSNGEPQTVVELAERTVESSQRQLEKAGEVVKKAGNAVGDTAKKTWQCLTTLFQKC
jgi:hypothetical protein